MFKLIIITLYFCMPLLAVAHYFLKPKYTVLRGKIESVGKDTYTSNVLGMALMKSLVFAHTDGKRELFKRVYIKAGLTQYLYHYRKDTLDGCFIIRNRFGFNFLFAYSDDRDMKFALARDMITPNSFVKKIRYGLLISFAGYSLPCFFLLQQGFSFSNIFEVLPLILTVTYFLWLKLFSNFGKEQFKIESSLLEENNIPVPLI